MTIDALPFATFIVSRLFKTLPKFAHARRAVAETERPIEGDEWYWADDNAKVLELFSLPEVWRLLPDVVPEVINFIIGMCEGPLIFRRLAAPRLTIDQNDGRQGKFRHCLMNVSCDLPKGQVVVGMRFHDTRTSRNVLFGGNYVRFRHGSRVHTVNVQKGIVRTAIEPREGSVRLVWVSTIDFLPNRISGRAIRLGELTYGCTISAGSMFIDLEAALEITPGLNVADVVLTFGCDELSQNESGIRYEMLSVASPNGESTRRLATQDERYTLPVAGARYWSIAQTSHMSGFAAAVHSLPAEPSRIVGLKVVAKGGRLHRVVSEHRFAGSQQGRLAAAERKIITAGGFYADTRLYADAISNQSRLSDAGGPPIDLSISYDYGAEINALARCLRTLRGGDAPVAGDEAAILDERLSEIVMTLSEAYDTYFIKPALTDNSAAFSRSLAYFAFAQAEMLRAGGGERHADALREICGVIAGFERINKAVNGEPQSGFVMGTEVDALPYVDCHATCLLALVRGTAALATEEWLPAIDRGLAAFCLDTQHIFMLGHQKIDVVCVDYEDPKGRRHRPETFWNFKSGLCLQLFGALGATSHPGLAAVWAKHKVRIELMELVMRGRIEHSLRRHEDGVEILTSMLSAETNSETQPWVALGLVGES